MAISISASAATPSLTFSPSTWRKPISPSSSPPLLASSTSSFFNEGSIRARFGLSIKPKSRTNTKKMGMSCTCLFGLGVPELAVIAGVAVLLFGPKQLPEVGRTFGKTIKSFQQAAKEFESELKKEPEPSADSSPEISVAQSNGEKQKPEQVTEEKQDVTVSNTKES